MNDLRLTYQNGNVEIIFSVIEYVAGRIYLYIHVEDGVKTYKKKDIAEVSYKKASLDYLSFQLAKLKKYK